MQFWINTAPLRTHQGIQIRMFSIDQAINYITQNGKHIKTPIILAFTSIWIATFTIHTLLTFYHESRSMTERITEQMQEAYSAYQQSIFIHSQLLEAALFQLSRNEKLMTFMKDRERKLLEKEIGSIFSFMRKTSEITHLYFIDETGSVFLRAHEPARYGDVISRESFQRAAREGESFSGLEFGFTGGLTLRTVLPVYDNQNVVGYLEAGIDVGKLHHELEAFQPLSVIEFIDKRFVVDLDKNKIEQSENRRLYQDLSQDYLVFGRNTNPIITEDFIQGIEEQFNKKDTYFFTIDKTLGIGVFPELDVGNQRIGFLIFVTQTQRFFDERNQLLVSVFFTRLIVLISGIALFYLVLSFIERENKRFQDELTMETAAKAKALEELEAAQTELVQQEKFASLGNLVAGISHEINTPVGICVTASSYLLERQQEMRKSFDSGKVKASEFDQFLTRGEETLASCLKAATRASDLIQSFKQIATDQSLDVTREVNIKAFVDEVLLTLGPKFKHTPYRIVVNCEAIELCLDTSGLYQVLSNLILNSLLHGFSGKDNGEITIDISYNNNKLVVNYADDGNGMNPELLQKLFDPFFTTRRNQGGTGLGTHIVYNLITQRMGGSIQVESQKNQGLRYHIEIPIEKGSCKDNDELL